MYMKLFLKDAYIVERNGVFGVRLLVYSRMVAFWNYPWEALGGERLFQTL